MQVGQDDVPEHEDCGLPVSEKKGLRGMELRNVQIKETGINLVLKEPYALSKKANMRFYIGTYEDKFKVAVKEYQPNELNASFEGDVKKLLEFKHPNIVRYYVNIPAGADAHLVVIDWFEGSQGIYNILGDLKAANQLQTKDCFLVLDQLFDAISYVHGKGVVHRDLHIGNILLNYDLRLMLVDFGLAKEFGSINSNSLHSGGYQSPQHHKNEEPTAYADIYQSGMLMYEIFTGSFSEQPLVKALQGYFDEYGKSSGKKPYERLHEFVKAEDLGFVGPDTELRKNLESIVKRAIHPEEEKAYPNSDAMRFDLGITYKLAFEKLNENKISLFDLVSKPDVQSQSWVNSVLSQYNSLLHNTGITNAAKYDTKTLFDSELLKKTNAEFREHQKQVQRVIAAYCAQEKPSSNVVDIIKGSNSIEELNSLELPPMTLELARSWKYCFDSYGEIWDVLAGSETAKSVVLREAAKAIETAILDNEESVDLVYASEHASEGRSCRIKKREYNAFQALAKYSPEILVENEHMVYFKIQDQGLEQIPEELYQFRSLKTLILKNNKISSADRISAFDELETVDLSYNNLSKMPDLSKNCRLKKALIGANKFEEISGVENHPSLEVLNVGNCSLRSTKGMSGLKRLKKFYCNNNSISHFEIKDTPRLEFADFAGNPAGTQEGLEQAYSLKSLNISETGFASLEGVKNISAESIYLGGQQCDIAGLHRMIALKNVHVAGSLDFASPAVRKEMRYMSSRGVSVNAPFVQAFAPACTEIITAEDYVSPESLVQKAERILGSAVKGQEKAASFLAKAVYNHAAAAKDAKDDARQRILLSGPSGSGKQFSVWQAASLFQMPVGVVQCGDIHDRESAGICVEKMLEELVSDARAKYLRGIDRGTRETYLAGIGDVAQKVEDQCIVYAQNYGIVILDGADALSGKKELQESIADYLDGTASCKISCRDGKQANPCKFNAKNLLVFMLGSFSKPDSAVTGAVEGAAGSSGAVEKYGIIPRLAGNSAVHEFSSLTKDSLCDIVQSKLNCLVNLLNSRTDYAVPLPKLVWKSQDYRNTIGIISRLAENQGTGAYAIDYVMNAFSRFLPETVLNRAGGASGKLNITAELVSDVLSRDPALKDLINKGGGGIARA